MRETHFFKVLRRVLSGFPSWGRIYHLSRGKIGGVRYSWDVVLLVIDPVTIGLIFGLSFCWDAGSLGLRSGGMFGLGSAGVMVIKFACSRCMRSRSILIAMSSFFLLFAFFCICWWIVEKYYFDVSYPCGVRICWFYLHYCFISFWGWFMWNKALVLIWIVAANWRTVGDVMYSEASLVASIFCEAFVSLSISINLLFSDCGVADVSVCRNDQYTSKSSLFCRAACLNACSKASPGVFFVVRGLFRESSLFN